MLASSVFRTSSLTPCGCAHVSTSWNWVCYLLRLSKGLSSIGNPFCHHALVREIHRWLRTLRERARTVHFCWVPGHGVVAASEKADLEAAAGATNHNHIAPTRLPTFPFLISAPTPAAHIMAEHWDQQTESSQRLCFSLDYLLSTESVPWSHSVPAMHWTHTADAPTSSKRWWASSL